MTVANSTTKVTAQGNGTATVFSFSPLVIYAPSDLVVVKVAADGTETPLTEGVGASNYSMRVSQYPGIGSIVFPASGTNYLANGEELVMKRVLPLTQERHFETEGGYFPEDVEQALDRAAMVDLQQQEELDRCVKVPINNLTDLDALTDDLITLSSIVADITTVSGLASDVAAVAAIDTDISTVSGITSDISTVSGVSADVSAVATNIADVLGVSADLASINSVAADLASINSVAADIGAININATNIAPIQAASANAIAAAASVTAAAASATAAAASAAAVNLPSAAGHGLNYMRQKATEDGFEYRTPTQVAADISVAYDTLVAGEAIDTSVTPKLVYKDEFNQRGGGADRWWLVDTDATGPVKISPTVAFATSSAAGAGSTFTGAIRSCKVAGFTGLTSGAAVWAHSTAGALTQTAPIAPSSGTQNAVRIVGYAASATEVEFQPHKDTVFQSCNSALAAGSSITLEHWTDGGARERVARAYIAAAAGTNTVSTSSTGWTAPSAPTFGGTGDITTSASSAEQYYRTAAELTNDFDYAWTQRNQTGTGTLPSNYTFQFGVNTAAPSGNNSLYVLAQATMWWVSHNGVGASQTVTLYNGTTVKQTVANVAIANGDTWAIRRRAGALTLLHNGASIGTFTGYSSTSANYLVLGKGNALASIFGAVNWTVNVIPARDEPITVGSESIDSAATDRATFKFADASDANQDTFTTAYNRTGATRNIIVEVALS